VGLYTGRRAMQTPGVGREKLFNIRFNDEDWARIEKLCAFHGVNAASLLRTLLKNEERDVDARHPGWAPTEAQSRAIKVWLAIEAAAVELDDKALHGELTKSKTRRSYYYSRHGVPPAILPQEKVALAALEAALHDRLSPAARDRAVRALEQLTDAYMH
jgi:hypothetical protein